MKKTFIILGIASIFVLLFFSFFYPTRVFAGDPSAGGIVPCGGTGQSPCTLCHFIIGFSNLVKYGLYIVIVIALVAIFFAGVMYIVSTGDEGMMTSAKSFLKAALIGFAVVFGGWLIINATLWALSAKGPNDEGGGLGIQKANWNTFTCSTASSAFSNPLGPIPGSGASALPPGVLGGTCGPAGQQGLCTAGTTGDGGTNATCSRIGKIWIMGGTSCPNGVYCCANPAPAGPGAWQDPDMVLPAP